MLERVMANPDRRDSRRAREICLKTHGMFDARCHIYMICHCGCRSVIYPGKHRWRADHASRWAEGGRDTPDNLWPILEACDAGKDGKAARDTKIIAHGKRAGAKHMGWRKQSGRPLPGTRRSGLRKRMDGTVERW